MTVKNHQWEVTQFGIESVRPAPEYPILKSRLTETTERGRATYYDWPIHLADKSWVDIEAFLEAFADALSTHAGS
jgi:hypothetical protein